MSNTEQSKIIDVVESTRRAAARALVDTLGTLGEDSSERALCDQWLLNISRTESLYPEGWYQPPPGGACILIGHPEDGFKRLNYDSLRHPTVWSRDDIRFREDSLIYAYASPTNRATGLIGDIGVTLYRGEEAWVRDYLATCLDVTTRVADFAEVGMDVRELFKYGLDQIENAKLSNETASTSSGIPNIGHTIPWSDACCPSRVLASLDHGEETRVRDEISKGRVFINAAASISIQPTMAFTIEPQVKSPGAPLCSYHVIVCFSGGAKTTILSFGDLFQQFGMTGYMEPAYARLTGTML